MLVLDNASVHVGSDSWELATGILQAAQVELWFLPCYSPELDAAEFVFGEVKKFISHNRARDKILWADTLRSLARIDQSKMWGFYWKALFGWMKP